MIPRITKEGSYPPLPVNRNKHELFLRELLNNLPDLEKEAKKVLSAAADEKKRVLIMALNQVSGLLLLLPRASCIQRARCRRGRQARRGAAPPVRHSSREGEDDSSVSCVLMLILLLALCMTLTASVGFCQYIPRGSLAQGDVDMLLNFLCSAHEHNIPLDNLVVFGGDQVERSMWLTYTHTHEFIHTSCTHPSLTQLGVTRCTISCFSAFS
jgi:hypothetical protein